MKTIIYLSLLFGLCSCNEPTVEKIPIDKLVYDLCVSLKQKDINKFKSYFDLTTINGTSESQFNYVFNNAVANVSNYELPSFEIWKKNWIFFENDSINHIVRVGLPFIRKATTATPESYLKISYNVDGKFSGLVLQNVTTFNELPDRMFPNKKEKFEFSVDNVIKIRLYFLPGQNTDSEYSKSIEFKEDGLTENIKLDFRKILDVLNSTKIISGDKGAIHEQTNTNDLKAVLFDFKDGNDVLNLSVLNATKLDKYVEVNTFYTMNAAIIYQLSETDKSKIQKLLDQFISKYTK